MDGEIQFWTRISLEDDDFTDVVEDYDIVKGMINDAIEESVITGFDKFIELNSIAGYRISIDPFKVISFYEGGIDILKRIWEREKKWEEFKREVQDTPSWD